MDQKTLGKALENLRHKCFRLAYRIVMNREEAEDIVQEILTRVWYMNKQSDKIRNIEAFSMTATKNLALDKLKRLRKTVHSEDFTVYDPVGFVSPEQHFVEKELVACVGEIINTLSVQQRIIIQLRDVEGYDYQEISEITGMNLNKLRVTLSRARKTVREQLLKINHYGSE